MTTTQSLNELNNHLDEQLGFLKSSADAYDQGNTTEAKRLALTLRLLLHDTTNSKSLLGQLGLKNRIFYDSSSFERYNGTPWDVGVYTGLIGQCINIETEQISYIPILDRSADKEGTRWVGFEEWWNMVVIKDEVGHIFSRRDLILTMANKDGGAHIDPILTGKYAAISRQNSLGWKGSMRGSAFQPISHPERAAVRQIAHEFLKSLDPAYTKNGCCIGKPWNSVRVYVSRETPFDVSSAVRGGATSWNWSVTGATMSSAETLAR